MVSAYVPLIIFLLFAAFVPASMLVGSRFLRRTTVMSRTKGMNYESAEEPIGTRMAIMKEYIYYFPMFLAFEIIAAILLIWAVVAKQLSFVDSMVVLALAVFGFFLEIMVMMIAKGGEKNG